MLRKALGWVWRILGIAGDIHFAWVTLGVGAVVTSIVSAAVSSALRLPWWATILLAMGTLMVSAGIVGVVARRFMPALVRGDREVAHESTRVRRAVDIAVTWLYRRANWDGLTDDGRYSEPAPDDIWARKKYDELGIGDLSYSPPETVMAEPGLSAGSEAWRGARDSTALHRLLGEGWAKLHEVSRLPGSREDRAPVVRAALDAWETDVRRALRDVEIDATDFDARVDAAEGMHFLDRPLETFYIKLARLESMLK